MKNAPEKRIGSILEQLEALRMTRNVATVYDVTRVNGCDVHIITTARTGRGQAGWLLTAGTFMHVSKFLETILSDDAAWEAACMQ